jgi:hypothetical protein
LINYNTIILNFEETEETFSASLISPENESSKKRCERLENSISIIQSTLIKHEQDIKQLQIATAKQDKILHSGPILPFTNAHGKTRDLAKDFDCASTANIYARSIANFLWPDNEIAKYIIMDEGSRDKSHQTDRIPFSSDEDLKKIEKLKGK